METLRNLEIEATKSAPAISFHIDGYLKIEGRFIPDNASTLFEPLFNWIKNLTAEKVVFDINLQYLNTSSSMQLFSLLRRLEENCLIKELVVNWYFEEDDEDHFETGLFYEEKLYRTKFIYKEVA
jgi:hypothetical protein